MEYIPKGTHICCLDCIDSLTNNSIHCGYIKEVINGVDIKGKETKDEQTYLLYNGHGIRVRKAKITEEQICYRCLENRLMND